MPFLYPWTVLPAMTVALNPNTGDRNSTILWIVIAALVVSAAAIIALALSAKKNKRRKR